MTYLTMITVLKAGTTDEVTAEKKSKKDKKKKKDKAAEDGMAVDPPGASCAYMQSVSRVDGVSSS